MRTTICTQAECVYSMMKGKNNGTKATIIQWTTHAEEKAIPKRSQMTFFILQGIHVSLLIVYNELSILVTPVKYSSFIEEITCENFVPTSGLKSES